MKVNCIECIFYTPKPGDPMMGLCKYKNCDEIVFEDDFLFKGRKELKDV